MTAVKCQPQLMLSIRQLSFVVLVVLFDGNVVTAMHSTNYFLYYKCTDYRVFPN